LSHGIIRGFLCLNNIIIMKTTSIILTAVTLISLLSCGRKEYTEQGILEVKEEIDSLLYNPEAEEHFNWGSARAYSNFRAYYHKSNLTYNPNKIYNNVEMMVDPDGNVIAYDKFVNGKRMSLNSEEIDAIVDHAEQLRDIVNKKSAIVRK